MLEDGIIPFGRLDVAAGRSLAGLAVGEFGRAFIAKTIGIYILLVVSAVAGIVMTFRTAPLIPQVLGYFRENPLGVIAYGAKTIQQICRFVFLGRADSASFAQRVRLVIGFIRIHLCVPGAVTLLECLLLAESALGARSGGCFIEVGAFKGRSTCCLSLIAALRGIDLIVIDTFSGLPSGDAPYAVSTDPSRTYIFDAGEYASSEREFLSNLHRFGKPGPVEVLIGDIAHMNALPLRARISFAFLDVDLTASYAACISRLGPWLMHGSIVAFHEGLLEPIRALIEDADLWNQHGLERPSTRYIADQRSLHTLLAVSTMQPIS